jgi:uncharacterized membrane protein
MKRFVLYALLFAATVITGHMVTLHLVPEVIMDRTFKAMEARGITPHTFSLAPKATPQSQTVVRPSPDLAYSICLYDFTDNPKPLYVSAAHRYGAVTDSVPSPPANGTPTDNDASYASISFFDARTNNFATIRVQENNQAANSAATGGRPNKSVRTDTILLPPGAGPDILPKEYDTYAKGDGSPHIINAPTTRGIILIRRLAPSNSDYAKLQQVAPMDRCHPL